MSPFWGNIGAKVDKRGQKRAKMGQNGPERGLRGPEVISEPLLTFQRKKNNKSQKKQTKKIPFFDGFFENLIFFAKKPQFFDPPERAENALKKAQFFQKNT